MPSGLDTFSLQSSRLKEGPGTIHLDGDMFFLSLFNSPPEIKKRTPKRHCVFRHLVHPPPDKWIDVIMKQLVRKIVRRSALNIVYYLASCLIVQCAATHFLRLLVHPESPAHGFRGGLSSATPSFHLKGESSGNFEANFSNGLKIGGLVNLTCVLCSALWHDWAAS